MANFTVCGSPDTKMSSTYTDIKPAQFSVPVSLLTSTRRHRFSSFEWTNRPSRTTSPIFRFPAQSGQHLISMDAPVPWRGHQPIKGFFNDPHIFCIGQTKVFEDGRYLHCRDLCCVTLWSVQKRYPDVTACQAPSPQSRGSDQGPDLTSTSAPPAYRSPVPTS